MSYHNGRLFVMAATLTALVVGIGAFIAGFVHGEPAGRAAAIAELSPQPSRVAVKPVPAGDGTALRALLIPQPTGSQPMTVKDSQFGAQTVDQFVSTHFDSDPRMAAALRSRGFEVATTRAWIGTSAQGETQLIQFRDGSGAEGFVLQQEASIADQKDLTSSYAIGQLERGHGYVLETAAKTDSVHVSLMCAVGPFVVLMQYESSSVPDRATETAALVRQAQALAA